jgi:hypothetical protein
MFPQTKHVETLVCLQKAVKVNNLNTKYGISQRGVPIFFDAWGKFHLNITFILRFLSKFVEKKIFLWYNKKSNLCVFNKKLIDSMRF